MRIDCRADRDGEYRIFDLNMKPNVTGVGRPGRADQDSLSLIAARDRLGLRAVAASDAGVRLVGLGTAEPRRGASILVGRILPVELS